MTAFQPSFSPTKYVPRSNSFGASSSARRSVLSMRGSASTIDREDELKTSRDALAELTQVNDSSAPKYIGNYQVLARIGAGSDADVWRVYSPRFNDEFAAKVLRPQNAMRPEEIGSLMNLDHSRIVRCYDHFLWEDHYVMIFELCKGGSLSSEIERAPNGVKPERLRKIAFQLFRGLEYCHAQGIAHHDIKPANILFRDEAHQVAVLADFGFAATVTGPGHVVKGTPLSMAPEILRRVPYDPCGCDIWALGMTLAFLANGYHPLRGASTMEEALALIRQGKMEFQTNLPDDIWEILHSMLQTNPEARPTAADLCKAAKIGNERALPVLVAFPGAREGRKRAASLGPSQPSARPSMAHAVRLERMPRIPVRKTTQT
jgi:serine/threonine protein kinase